MHTKFHDQCRSDESFKFKWEISHGSIKFANLRKVPDKLFGVSIIEKTFN